MQRRRTAVLVSATLLTVAACGTGSDDSTSSTAREAPIATGAPAEVTVDEGDATPAAPPATDGASPTDAASPSDAEADTSETDTVEPTDTAEAPAEATSNESDPEPVSTDAPEAAAPAEPVVGGRLLAADVQPAAQFDGNPFPDLVVDDIGKDARVNIANILPSDRPVLLWAWAPH